MTGTSGLRPDEAAIKDALNLFVGDIMQVPPQFSAVKIDGERAYKRARDGEAIDIAARPLFVESLLLNDRPDPDHIVLEMVCGKGGYVRSIARDLGAHLGCLGHVQDLRRTWSGPFAADGAVPLSDIEGLAHTPAIDTLLLPLEQALADVPMATTTAEGAARLRNGNPALCIVNADYGDDVWVQHGGKAIALGPFRGGEVFPKRVIHT